MAKRSKRDQRSDAQRALDERADRSRAQWAVRHPAAAAEERRLRKARAETLDRWDHKHQGTPETHEFASRRNQGALARLYQTGAIDAEQLSAAVEIATVHERIGSEVAVKTASLETRVDVTRIGDGGFFERLGQVRREVAYTRWRHLVQCGFLGRKSGNAIAPVLDMIVGSSADGGPAGFTTVARRHRMGNARARQLLLDALDLWPVVLGGVCKEIDDKQLAAAHARLAA